MAKRTGLGRDFYSTFSDNSASVAPKGYGQVLRISDIEPRKGQPRKQFDEGELEALAESIKQYGVLQPIIVHELPNSPGFYEIIAGERRWRAARLAELSEIPAVVIDSNEQNTAVVSLIENIQRRDLNPVEEAFAYSDLITSFGMTQEEVAKRIGKSRPAVANMLRLLELPDEVINMLKNGDITAGHARALLGLDSKEDTVPLAERAIARQLSVRDVEAIVKRLNSEHKKDAEPEPVDGIPGQKNYYMKDLERRTTQALGRRVRIFSTGKHKSLEICYNDDLDLEEIISKLCGKDFFSDNGSES